MTQQAYATAHDAYTIDPAAMDQLFFEARSANSFSGEPVSDETLEAIYDAMKMGPTLMNNQPLRISWIKSDEARNAIAATMSGSNAAKALAAPALAVLSFDPEWHEQFPSSSRTPRNARQCSRTPSPVPPWAAAMPGCRRATS